MTDIECILTCRYCGDIYNVERKPSAQEGVFTHRIVPIGGGDPVISAKECPKCHESLERKEPENAA